MASLDLVSPGAEYNECHPGCHPTRNEAGSGKFENFGNFWTLNGLFLRYLWFYLKNPI